MSHQIQILKSIRKPLVRKTDIIIDKKTKDKNKRIKKVNFNEI